MSASLFLVLDMDGKAEFDQEKLRACLKGMNKVTAWREGTETVLSDWLLFECDYQINNDSTMISVPKDRRFISIHGTGSASLDAALQIQRNYQDRIFAVVADCPGDHVDLSTVCSIDEISNRLRL
jgi:hypothetical protein